MSNLVFSNLKFNSSALAVTAEGKLMTSILYSAIQDLLNGTTQHRKAASKWLFHCKNNELRNICLYIVGIDFLTLNKLLVEKMGEKKFEAAYELGKKRLKVERSNANAGRLKKQGVKRTPSGAISRAKEIKQKAGRKRVEGVRRIPSGKIYKYVKKGRKLKEGVVRLPSGRISRAKGLKRGRPAKIKGDANE
jgi:hypothetical protein